MMARRTRSVARVGIVVFAAVAVLGTAAVASAGDDHPAGSKSKSKDASKSRSKSKSKSDHPGSHTSADMPGMKMSGTKAGKTMAVLRSFVASCELAKVDPFAWFQDVLTRIGACSMKQLDDLLPHRWVQAPA